jgi:hypothetical protein
MAEDQGVNGTIWNKEATRLLSYFGWKTIGDYDMDVEGEDGKKYGLDTIIKYPTPLKINEQSVILEAKCYETKNFNKSVLESWIDRLDKKLIELRNSESFIDKFPELQDCSVLDTGIIAIWFHDTQNYVNFHSVFIEILKGVKVSNRQRKVGINKLFIIDNSIILKLCSLNAAIDSYKKENNCEVQFNYPSILIEDAPIVRQNTLTLEYIFSKVILAESKNANLKENLVFYFGELKTVAFKLLRNLLARCSFLEKDKPLTLFIYGEDREFRKIEPDIKRVFEAITFKIRSMDNLHDLPASIKNVIHE